jgi:antitoxin component of MazEF toxin-antitoxin module
LSRAPSVENRYLFFTNPTFSTLILWYTIDILKIDLEVFMIAKKLTKVGNTQAVVLDKTLLSLVDADTESTFRISVDGKKIVLEAMSQKEVDRMALEASDKIRRVQKNVFTKLAK